MCDGVNAQIFRLTERLSILETKLEPIFEAEKKAQAAQIQMLQNEIAKRDRRIKELEANAPNSTS